MSTSSPRPQKRTAHTCITCRTRKVRCDGRRGICTNCERLGLPCSYSSTFNVDGVLASDSSSGQMQFVEGNATPSPPSPNTILIPRRRARQACQNCHAKKARCGGSMPQCDRCRNQGLECVYRPSKRSLPLLSRGQSPREADSQQVGMQHDGHVDDGSFTPSGTASPIAPALELSFSDPPEALALRAFDNYFRHVHHIPMFSFLHRVSVMERYHAGGLNRSLLLALIGITALLTDLGPGTKEYGNRCIDQAASMCLSNMENPSIFGLQALIIITKHRILSKRYQGAFMLHALASRFAAALRLNHENPSLCFLAQESRRRLMWSLYMVDAAISNGQAELALWPDPMRQIHVQLPCNERNFEFDLPEVTEPLRPPDPLTPDSRGGEGIGGMLPPAPPLADAVGLMALHVRVHWIRTRILRRAMRAVSSNSSTADLAALPSDCASLVAELDAFENRLPLSFRWSESSLKLRLYSPRLGIFFMTHIWWQQCHLDLYRLFLTGLKEALPWTALGQFDPDFIDRGRRSCYEHARAMADMFAQLLAPGTSIPIADMDLAGCAFQCVRVLCHGLQTAGSEIVFNPSSVLELASVCLRAAQQSTTGPACASIQADIEKLITNGLPIPGDTHSAVGTAATDPQERMNTEIEVPTTRLPQTNTDIPLVPPTNNTFLPYQTVPIHTTTTTVPSTAQVLARSAASIAPSQTSMATTASNAFEQSLEDLNFGFWTDMFGAESWDPGYST